MLDVLLAFAAGVLTIAAPCVLPIVLGAMAKSVISEIRKGADPEKFKASGQQVRFGYSYHNHWWIPHDADGTFEAKG